MATSAMNIANAKTPVIEYSSRWDVGICTVCGDGTTPETKFARIAWTYVKRGARYCFVEPVCQSCMTMLDAVEEARQDMRRFTEVCVAIPDTPLANYYGPRCLCGGVALAKNDLCIQCWRAQRMLSKTQAVIREIKQMTANLNKQIKEQIKNGTQ